MSATVRVRHETVSRTAGGATEGPDSTQAVLPPLGSAGGFLGLLGMARTLRGWGAITRPEYVDLVNHLRKSAGYEALPEGEVPDVPMDAAGGHFGGIAR